jgi:DtxR family transcriptional regulator, manganese transport regulator
MANLHRDSPDLKPTHLECRDRHQGLGVDDRLTESGEDYLACIFELLEKKGCARVADVAESLSVSEASASAMIKRLAQKGYLKHEKYRRFTLTESGHAMARDVHARRRMLTAFLQYLGLPQSVIRRDVHGLEHHLSEETLEQLRLFLQSHGDQKPV